MKWLILLLTSDKYLLLNFFMKIRFWGNLHIFMRELLSMRSDDVQAHFSMWRTSFFTWFVAP